MSTSSSSTGRGVWWSILSVAIVLSGLLAIAAPMAAGLAATIVVGWLIALSGGGHMALALEPRRLGSRLWHALAGLIYLIGGAFVALWPGVGLLSLTMVLAAMFLVGGVFRIAASIKLRAVTGAGWLFADGILTLLLAVMIYVGWPASSHWVVGTLVGVTLLMNGIAGFMFSLAAPKAGATSDKTPEGHVPVPEMRQGRGTLIAASSAFV